MIHVSHEVKAGSLISHGQLQDPLSEGFLKEITNIHHKSKEKMS